MLQSSTGTASYDLGLQSQQVPSILSVPSDSLKLNHTGSVLFDSVFSRYHGLFWSSVYFNTNFGSIVASRILCSLIGLLRTTQHFPIQHSTSPLCLRLVGLSQFLHFTCKLSLFQFISFPPLSFPLLTFSNLFYPICFTFKIYLLSIYSF